MYRIGVDIGSTYTKYCVMEETGKEPLLFSEPTPVRQREYFAERIEELKERYAPCTVVTCGYGRHNAAHDGMVTELTALAAGAGYQCPDTSVVLDIGGQDTKLIRQEGGRIRAFFVNEKCAAGCGMFLKNTLSVLDKTFEGIRLEGAGKTEIRLSSVCAVFAQSEIVELIADGAPEEGIIEAVLGHIFTQAKALLTKTDCERIALSGGLAKILGIGAFAEGILGKQVLIPQNAAYLSAIGCALTDPSRLPASR